MGGECVESDKMSAEANGLKLPRFLEEFLQFDSLCFSKDSR